MLTLFEQALIMHLIGDWILQNDWMASQKSSLKHPAAWVHATIHLILLSFVLGLPSAIILAAIHMMIDTRKPFRFWRKMIKMTSEGPSAIHVSIWTDQVLHILCLAAWVQFFARYF